MARFILVTTKSFDKKLKNFLKSHRELAKNFAKTFIILERNPFDSILKTHKLGGALKGAFASSINYNYRVVFTIDENMITLHNIGSHDEVYS